MFELVLVFFSLLVIHYKFGGRRRSMDLLSSLQGAYNKWEPWNKVPGAAVEAIKGPAPRKIPPFVRSVSTENGHKEETTLRRKISLGNMKTNRISLVPAKETKGAFGALCQFKSMPTLFPECDGSKTGRRFCCSKCSPSLRKTFSEGQSLGLRNILLVSTMNTENNFLVRKFHYLAHILKTKASFVYPDAAECTLNSERVQNAIENAATSDMEDFAVEDATYSKLLAVHRKRAAHILNMMKARISTLLIRLTAWVLFKVLGRLLSSIQVQKSQLDMIKKLNKSSVPVVYLPLHRSHLDYILVTFILYNYEVKAPLVAAGDNLRIPVFGHLMNGLGGFFIKRKLDPKKGKKDFVYRSVLHTYMEQSLNEGHSLEFFIEGGRSRSGKACLPKAGLLSVVVDAFLDGSIEDIYFVPVGISYDKLLDGSFISEQMGKPKVMENFASAVRGIYKTFRSHYGSVRVDFARPFSMREFVQAAVTYTPTNPRSFLDVPSSPQQMLRRISSSASLYGTDIVIEDQRQLVRELAEHVLYDAVHSTALMSTNLVAFLLLNKYRKGVLLRSLIQDFNWLWDELGVRGRQAGFSGSPKDIVVHALNLLGEELVHVATPSNKPLRPQDDCDLAFIKANLEVPRVLEVAYYSNVALSAFLGDAIIANSLFALLGEELNAAQDCDSKLTVSQNQLLEKSLDLCHILQYEFILTAPCQTLEAYLTDVIQEFINTEFLARENEGVDQRGDGNYSREYVRNFQFSDASEEEDDYICSDVRLKVNLEGGNIQKLKLFRNILAPFLEGYWHVCRSLAQLVQNEMEENAFVRLVQKTVQDKNSQGLIECSECVAAETLKNAIKLFESWSVLDCYLQDNIKVLFLAEGFDSEEAIGEVLLVLDPFKK